MVSSECLSELVDPFLWTGVIGLQLQFSLLLFIRTNDLHLYEHQIQAADLKSMKV